MQTNKPWMKGKSNLTVKRGLIVKKRPKTFSEIEKSVIERMNLKDLSSKESLIYKPKSRS